MRSRQIHLLVTGVLSLALSGCTRAEPEPEPDRSAATPAAREADPFPPGPYPDRDAALARELVEAGALLLDVRSADEFARGHIDGAVNIPHTEIATRSEEILALQAGDRQRPIVLYCGAGGRAGLAKSELEAAGFARLSNLGGIGDWPDSPK